MTVLRVCNDFEHQDVVTPPTHTGQDKATFCVTLDPRPAGTALNLTTATLPFASHAANWRRIVWKPILPAALQMRVCLCVSRGAQRWCVIEEANVRVFLCLRGF